VSQILRRNSVTLAVEFGLRGHEPREIAALAFVGTISYAGRTP
jgi:hypothetical protein